MGEEEFAQALYKTLHSEKKLHSLIHVSSEDVEASDTEENLVEEDVLSINGSVLKTLFRSEEGPISGKIEAAPFKQREQMNIPQHLLSIIEDCNLTFG